MCYMIILLITASLLTGEPGQAGQQQQIGVSSSILATAFNNSRKIARTLADRRVVVYQDLIEGQDTVMLTFSDDGKAWREPRLLAYGSSPTVAVSNADTFYVLWDSFQDNGLCLAAFAADEIGDPLNSGRRIVIPDERDGYRRRLPSVDVDEAFVHLIFHSMTGADSRVVYYAVKRDLSPIPGFSPFALTPGVDAGDAVIAADLEYEPGRINLLWTIDKLHWSNIVYCAFDLKTFVRNGVIDSTALRHHLTVENLPQILEETEGCAHPSLSVRNDHENLQLLTCGWDNQSQLQVAWAIADTYDAGQVALSFYETNLYPVSAAPMPSVDDVYVPSSSCAIVWQNDDGVQYGQTFRGAITTRPFVDVSQSAVFAFSPSVCYKTFRADSFDVVWTESAGDRYRVMYRRMAKVYDANGVRASAQEPKDFRLTSVSPNPFNSAATIRYELARPAAVNMAVYNLAGERIAELVGETKPEGVHTIVWNAETFAGGIYIIRFTADGRVALKKCMLIK